VNIGTSANKGNGDPLRTAFGKINDNFDEIYGAIGADGSIFNPLSVDQSLVPTTTNTVDLGSASKQWRSLYVSNNTIYIGGVAIGVDGNGNLTTGGTVVGSTPAWANITGKPTFATVATSGDYADLSGKPTIPTVVNASFQINDQSFTPGSVYAATLYSITVTPSSTSAPVSVTFNLSIVANPGQEDAGYGFKIYVNGSPVDSSELINYIDDSPTSYSAYPATYTFNFVPGTNSSTTIALWAKKTGGNGWRFVQGGISAKHVVTALVF